MYIALRARQQVDFSFGAIFMLRTLIVFCIVSGFVTSAYPADRVTVQKTPNGGIQPQAVTDHKGTLHLIYFKGDAAGGDLYYARGIRGKTDFSNPLRVNSQAKSAIATGTVRGGQIAIGSEDRVHVAWNGSGAAPGTAGMLYSRLSEAGDLFETQRDLMEGTSELDGGGTVVADSTGNVYVAWHAVRTGEHDEANRRVWVARSSDDGQTFSRAAAAQEETTGICGCCSMRGLADSKGAVLMLYRSASDGDNRDVYLLSSGNNGTTFKKALLQKWKIAACPMSTMALTRGPRDVVAAWDSDGQIHFARIDAKTNQPGSPQAPPGRARNRKHPTVAVNAEGTMLVAWTEGTGWQKGGDLVWQLFDKSGKPVKDQGRVQGGIPIWGLPTVVATDDGFTIIH
jgi:hypothetical protein